MNSAIKTLLQTSNFKSGKNYWEHLCINILTSLVHNFTLRLYSANKFETCYNITSTYLYRMEQHYVDFEAVEIHTPTKV